MENSDLYNALKSLRDVTKEVNDNYDSIIEGYKGMVELLELEVELHEGISNDRRDIIISLCRIASKLLSVANITALARYSIEDTLRSLNERGYEWGNESQIRDD